MATSSTSPEPSAVPFAIEADSGPSAESEVTAALYALEVWSGRIHRFSLSSAYVDDAEVHPAPTPASEQGDYRLLIVCDGGGFSSEARVVVNDGSGNDCRVVKGNELSDEGIQREDFETRRCPKWKPFQNIFGYARAEVTILLGGRETRLSTLDIPVGPVEGDAERIGGMYGTLFAEERDRAIDWMLEGVESERGRHSISAGPSDDRAPGEPENADGPGGSGEPWQPERSDPSRYLARAKSVLDGFERCLPVLRMRPYEKVGVQSDMADWDKVHRIGQHEIRWIARHPAQLQRTPARTGIGDGRASYLPRRIETSRRVTTLDVYENRAILAFLTQCLGELESLSSRLRRLLPRSAPRAVELGMRGDVPEDDRASAARPSPSILEGARTQAIRRLLGRARDLRDRARGLRLRYRQALPGAGEERFRALQMTAVFREMRPYDELYRLMCAWPPLADASRDSSRLALLRPQISDVYELYVLHGLLSALAGAGFGPEASMDLDIFSAPGAPVDRLPSAVFPIDRVPYEGGPKPPVVNNLYLLRRGGEQVRLYYQPVVPLEGEPQWGLGLRRTTPGKTPHYSPDFVLRHRRSAEDPWRSIVVDAKYKTMAKDIERPRSRKRPAPEDEIGGFSREFIECRMRYALNCVDAGTGRHPQCVWLVYGREDEGYLKPYERIPERLIAAGTALPSGVAALTPECGSAEELLHLLRII